MADKPEERMGAKRTVLLAIGGSLGVLLMSGLIHLVRQKGQTQLRRKL